MKKFIPNKNIAVLTDSQFDIILKVSVIYYIKLKMKTKTKIYIMIKPLVVFYRYFKLFIQYSVICQSVTFT